MNDEIAESITLVRVVKTDILFGTEPGVDFWVAAVPPEEAVAAVTAEIPPNWTAEICDDRLTQDQIRRLRMRPGTVSEWSMAIRKGRQ